MRISDEAKMALNWVPAKEQKPDMRYKKNKKIAATKTANNRDKRDKMPVPDDAPLPAYAEKAPMLNGQFRSEGKGFVPTYKRRAILERDTIEAAIAALNKNSHGDKYAYFRMLADEHPKVFVDVLKVLLPRESTLKVEGEILHIGTAIAAAENRLQQLASQSPGIIDAKIIPDDLPTVESDGESTDDNPDDEAK